MKYRTKGKLEARGPVDLNGVKEWCQQREIPDDSSQLDPHEVVVPFCNCLDPKRLYIHLTTKHLTGVASQADYVMTDATYKMNLHGFPVVITGHQDADRHFHQTGFHLVWDEETSEVYEEVRVRVSSIYVLGSLSVSLSVFLLQVFSSVESAPELFGLPKLVPKFVMGDGHKGISAAARIRFPQARRLACYFHVIDAVKKYRTLLPAANRDVSWKLVKQQIFDLHRAPSVEIFNAMANSIVREWLAREWKEFALYFVKQWLRACPYW